MIHATPSLNKCHGECRIELCPLHLGLAGKTDLNEAKAAMITKTTDKIFIIPVIKLITENDKAKQVCDSEKCFIYSLKELVEWQVF